MRERIKYFLLTSIPVYGIGLIIFFFKEDYYKSNLFLSLIILSIIFYLIIPNRKIKVDKNNNAIKKQK